MGDSYRNVTEHKKEYTPATTWWKKLKAKIDYYVWCKGRTGTQILDLIEEEGVLWTCILLAPIGIFVTLIALNIYLVFFGLIISLFYY